MKVDSSLVKELALRALRAALKGLVLAVLLLFFSQMLRRLAGNFGVYWYAVDVFVAVYISFVVAIEFLSKTIFQYMLGAGKELFIILYFMYVLNGGEVTVSMGPMQITADLRVLLLMLVSISLLGLGKNALQAVNFLNERDKGSVT